MKLRITAALVALSVLSAKAQVDEILVSYTPSDTAAPLIVSGYRAGIGATPLGRGDGLTYSSYGPGVWPSKGWGTGEAPEPGDHLETTITAYRNWVNVRTASFHVRISGGPGEEDGPTHWGLLGSLDGFASHSRTLCCARWWTPRPRRPRGR